MDNERSNEIRGHVANDYGATDASEGTWLRARYQTQIRADIEYLLAENERLQAVVTAARAIVDDAVQWDMDGDIVIRIDGKKYGWDTNEPASEPLVVGIIALRDALAALQAGEGD